MKVFFTPGDPGCAGGCGGTGRVTKQVTFADGSKGPLTVPCSCEFSMEAALEFSNVAVQPKLGAMRLWRGKVVPRDEDPAEDVYDLDRPDKQPLIDPSELEVPEPK